MARNTDTWNDGYKAAAVFSFDLDAEEVWRVEWETNPEYDKPSIRTRGRYGPEVGVPRILEVLRRHGVQATFFVPGKVVESYPETVQRIHEEGHELGHHGYTHTNPAGMTEDEEEDEIKKGLDAFDDVVGETPVGYRSPAADLSDNTLDILARNGFAYESSLIDNDLPYFHELENGKRIVEVPFEWSLNDWPYFGFNMWPVLPEQVLDPDQFIEEKRVE